MREMKIGNIVINDDSDCFVIAEVGHNHQGSVEKCKQHFKEAADAGCQAVKLQKRNNTTLFTKAAYDKPYENENSYADTYGAHREFLEFDMDQYREVKAYAESLGLIFMSTAFDDASVDFLEELGVLGYKMASGDLRTLPLVERIAKTGKPMFMSTGASYLDEVKKAYEVATRYNDQVCLMQCTSGYPIEPEEAHLNVIDTYLKEFPKAVIGYSGHDNGILIPVISYLKGARVIEKHFTLNRSWKGTDHKFSLEPLGMKKMVRDLKRSKACLGSGEKVCHDTEEAGRIKMGKSVFAAANLSKGLKLTEEHFSLKSPGGGITPDRLDEVIGKVLNTDIALEEKILFEHLN